MPCPRLSFDRWPAAVYAVGDIHGCLRQLLELQAQIVADAVVFPGEKWIVTLGDHIDRGPDSAGVVAEMLKPPPPQFRRFSLLGNHEQVMLEFLSDPPAHAYWLEDGGIETLVSYGLDLFRRRPPDEVEAAFTEELRRLVPAAHVEWMRRLPTMLSLPGWVFVHAGIRPGIALEAQADEDLIWIREPFLSSQLPAGHRVVHGHTPGPEPIVTPSRIGIDTQCFRTGRLTALRVTPDGATKLLGVGP